MLVLLSWVVELSVGFSLLLVFVLLFWVGCIASVERGSFLLGIVLILKIVKRVRSW